MMMFFCLFLFFRFVTSVYPSVDDDVITSPYNSVLAMRELTEHADCVLPVENQVSAF
jgi:tubulin epsilon